MPFFAVELSHPESALGNSLPLIGIISASAFSILCKIDLCIGKGEDNADNNRNMLVYLL